MLIGLLSNIAPSTCLTFFGLVLCMLEPLTVIAIIVSMAGDKHALSFHDSSKKRAYKKMKKEGSRKVTTINANFCPIELPPWLQIQAFQLQFNCTPSKSYTRTWPECLSLRRRRRRRNKDNYITDITYEENLHILLLFLACKLSMPAPS